MKTFTDELAGLMRDLLPAVIAESKDSGRESVQTVVWLVGLASGLITLLAAHSGTIAALTITQRRVLIPVLATTVVCGILQRIVNQLVERKERVLLFGLQGHLAAYGTQNTEPDQLNEQWAEDEIIQNIKAKFGSNLAPLAKLSLPIDLYRTLYTGHVEVWHEQQSKRLNALLEVLAAYGMYDPSSAMLAPADSLRFARKRVLTISRLRSGAFCLFVGTCATFLSALLFLAYAIFP